MLMRSAERQGVQQLSGPLADDRLQLHQTGRADDRLDRLSLHIVLGRIHGDEHRQHEVWLGIANGDAAQMRVTGEGLMVGVHRNDVVEPGDRPVGAPFAVGGVVDRVFLAQALEHRPEAIVPETGRITGIQLVQGRGPDLRAHGVQPVEAAIGHPGPPLSCHCSHWATETPVCEAAQGEHVKNPAVGNGGVQEVEGPMAP